MEHSGFPSDETLAQFIEGGLDPKTRRQVVEHMAECSECHETFLGSTEWGREVGGVVAFAPVRGVGLRRRLTVVAGVAAAVVVFLIQPAFKWYERYQWRSDFAALAQIANDLPDSAIQARLSGGFKYRPPQRTTRGSQDNDARRELAQWKILQIAQKNARSNPSSIQLHTIGAAYLLLSRSDDAIETLETAITEETGDHIVTDGVNSSRNSSLLSDLSAAYYQRFLWNKDPSDLRKSIAAGDRSWRLKQTPEAAWNRALALEAAAPSRAIAAWNDYLALDPQSAWSSVASSRLHAISDKGSSDRRDSVK